MNNINYFSEYPFLAYLFVFVIITMLVLDLWVFNREHHKVSSKQSLFFTLIWIFLSMIFSLFVYYFVWFNSFIEFQSAYWIEKALSVDNLFVFILIFLYFDIPKKYQHKVLFYWILWIIFFRAIFIFLWIELIHKTNFSVNFFGKYIIFNPILFIFWIFLLYSWLKSLLRKNIVKKDIKNSFPYKIVEKFLKLTPKIKSSDFFKIKKWLKMATPLFIALIMVTITDLIFAIDSIPAIFAITNDPFILYTSNIFAILWLHSFYFLLANSLNLFSKLHYWLSIILIFIWFKMILMPFYHFEAINSLLVISLVLIFTIILSFVFHKKKEKKLKHKLQQSQM